MGKWHSLKKSDGASGETQYVPQMCAPLLNDSVSVRTDATYLALEPAS